MKFILCVAQVLVMVHYALAWQNISEFETGIVGALSNNLVLTSRAFSDSLTNVIARPFNDETGMAARIVNGVRESRLYIETMDEDHLDKSFAIATNVCSRTEGQEVSWLCWQSELLRIGCHALRNDMVGAYVASSNALVRIRASSFGGSTNVISRALLGYYKSQNLTMEQSIRVLAAMSAGLLGKKAEAMSLATDLPSTHKIPIMNVIEGR